MFRLPLAELLLVVSLVMTAQVLNEVVYPPALLLPKLQNYL